MQNVILSLSKNPMKTKCYETLRQAQGDNRGLLQEATMANACKINCRDGISVPFSTELVFYKIFTGGG